MWSPDRRHLLAALATLPLAGCGFQPALAPGGPAAGLFDRIAFAAPTDRNAFDLVARLEDRLGRAGKGARYVLRYQIATEETALAITPSAAITRYNVTGSVTFRVETLDGAELATGKVRKMADWKNRFKENSEKMRCGSVFEVAEVFKILLLQQMEKTLSFREKKMLDRARQMMISEVSTSMAVPQPQAIEVIGKSLQRSGLNMPEPM